MQRRSARIEWAVANRNSEAVANSRRTGNGLLSPRVVVIVDVVRSYFKVQVVARLAGAAKEFEDNAGWCRGEGSHVARVIDEVHLIAVMKTSNPEDAHGQGRQKRERSETSMSLDSHGI